MSPMDLESNHLVLYSGCSIGDMPKVVEEKREFAVNAGAFRVVWQQHIPISRLEERFEEYWPSLSGAWECGRRGNNHTDIYIHSFGKKIQRALSFFEFEDLEAMCPHITINSAKGKSFDGAVKRGHFYNSCLWKVGNTKFFGDYQPIQDYAVNTEWVQDLWKQEKIKDNGCILCAGHYKCLTPYLERLVSRSVAVVTRSKRQKIGDDRTVRFLDKYAPSFLHFPELDTFRDQFREEQDRYKFLIVTGPSLCGKTKLIQHHFYREGLCEFISGIDWKKYDRESHKAVLFDDIPGIMGYVDRNHGMFQANRSVTVHGSETMCYSLEVDLADKPIIICCNPEEFFLTPWIKENSIVIEFGGDLKAFV